MANTNQGLRQESVRAVTGTTLAYNGDWIALFRLSSIDTGSFNGDMLAWINLQLGVTYTNLSGAQVAYAVSQGFSNWGSMGTFTPGGGGGATLITGETDAMGIDFTVAAANQVKIIDGTTPANNYTGSAQGKLTYTSPFIKLCLQSDGVWRYGSHNIYLNSAAPANQTVTVVSGGTYAIVITGSVSITWSSAFVGTTTVGTTNITAASTSLTGGSTSGTGTVTVYRTPCVGTYLATTSSAVYDLPFEWNAAGVAQGILSEEARTNRALRSQEFDNASWTVGSAAISANTTSAPDGTTTAETLTATAGSAAHEIFMSVGTAVTDSTVATYSVFAKKGTHRYLSVQTQGGATHWIVATFDLDGGGSTATQTAAGAGSGTVVSTSMINAGNGWFRCTLTGSHAGGTNTSLSAVTFAPAATGNTFGNFANNVFVAAGTETFHIWGFQAEDGAFPTSPIHTIGATVTRAVDNPSLLASAVPSSATLGTLYAKFNPINVGAIRFAMALDDGTANERFALGSSAAGAGSFSVIDGGVAQTAPLTSGTITAGAANKVAASWKANDFALSVNGGAAATDVSGTLPTVTTLRFGTAVAAASPLNGYLQHVVYLPRDMTDAELVTRSTP